VTGSGKTLAYAIPILERIIRQERKYKKNEIAAIVIAPTRWVHWVFTHQADRIRELATQIHSIFNLFLESIQPPPPEPTSPADPSSSRSPSPPPPPPEAEYPLPQLVTSGSKDVYEEFLRLKPSIIVGTPGRLASFLLSPRGVSLVRVTNFDVLVLDEADRLLSAADHRRDVEKIMKHLPKQRRTHLFSATMTDSVEELIGLGLRNPVRIVVNLKDKRKEGGEQPKERRTPSG
jgi:ATP-dependent RNA helicase DDX55/SPB4